MLPPVGGKRGRSRDQPTGQHERSGRIKMKTHYSTGREEANQSDSRVAKFVAVGKWTSGFPRWISHPETRAKNSGKNGTNLISHRI
jgi:hypothetical protein